MILNEIVGFFFSLMLISIFILITIGIVYEIFIRIVHAKDILKSNYSKLILKKINHLTSMHLKSVRIFKKILDSEEYFIETLHIKQKKDIKNKKVEDDIK